MTPPDNQLMQQIPVRDRQRLLSHAQLVELRPDDVLWERGQKSRHVYFPLTGFISLFTSIRGSAGLETGIVGDEGLVGTHVALGVCEAPQDAVVLASGQAWRVGVRAFAFELSTSSALRRRVNLYIESTMLQLMTTVACVRFHEVGARLARWLLMSHERAHADGFEVTQEALARILGVRRTGVSEAAAQLQRAGLITYIRGHLTIKNRRGLESAACACQQNDRLAYTS